MTVSVDKQNKTAVAIMPQAKLNVCREYVGGFLEHTHCHCLQTG